ncbi:MAG: thioredoxin family protein [Methanospirillum sp.]|uniref:thioredoxin family protein n=1 Tax=Methanospirillum sp. TaxID=45200 RepID=UPI0023740545|nr:thioredoxin family protein [Methanospirillum sp.]MDD1729411.1 thioredoxin family protein [Methanospirillum sp.]
MHWYLTAMLTILLSIALIALPATAASENATIPDSLGSIPFIGDITSGMGSDTPVVIHFFFNPGCGACEKIHPVMEAYAANHSDVRVEFYSLAGNQTNIDLFNTFQQAYNISHAHVPILFLGTTNLMGEDEISKNLDATVAETKKGNYRLSLLPNLSADISSSPVSTINPAFLVIAGIGEGLNPCGLLVLALLLVSLMASQSRRTVLAIGLAYIVAFFAVRFLSGFAIFSVIQLPGISQAFTLIAAAVAIIAGIIQVKDGLSKKQNPILSIPTSKKSLISSYMKQASVPAGLIVGALVGIYGMACTAGIYISILGMLYKEPAIGLLYLVLYNILVIIPLLAILLLVFFGIPPEKVNAWRDDQKSMLRLMIGIVMIIMGIVILIPMLN